MKIACGALLEVVSGRGFKVKFSILNEMLGES